MQNPNDFDKLPTSTVNQARLQVYQWTRRPEYREVVIETSWGRARIEGKLGQAHAHMMEAICWNAIDWGRNDKTGQLTVLVDPYQIRLSMSKDTEYSFQQMGKLINELRKATIQLSSHSWNVDHIIGGFIDLVQAADSKKNNPWGGERNLWQVTINTAYVRLFDIDIHLHYDPGPIARLTNGITQAIVRHILTHKTQPTGGWHLDTLIKLVGAECAGGKVRRRRAEILEDLPILETLGINITNMRVTTTNFFNQRAPYA